MFSYSVLLRRLLFSVSHSGLIKNVFSVTSKLYENRLRHAIGKHILCWRDAISVVSGQFLANSTKNHNIEVIAAILNNFFTTKRVWQNMSNSY